MFSVISVSLSVQGRVPMWPPPWPVQTCSLGDPQALTHASQPYRHPLPQYWQYWPLPLTIQVLIHPWSWPWLPDMSHVVHLDLTILDPKTYRLGFYSRLKGLSVASKNLPLCVFFQKLPERRRETCYYQDSSHAASVTVEDDYGTFHGQMVIRSNITIFWTKLHFTCKYLSIEVE